MDKYLPEWLAAPWDYERNFLLGLERAIVKLLPQLDNNGLLRRKLQVLAGNRGSCILRICWEWNMCAEVFSNHLAPGAFCKWRRNGEEVWRPIPLDPEVIFCEVIAPIVLKCLGGRISEAVAEQERLCELVGEIESRDQAEKETV